MDDEKREFKGIWFPASVWLDSNLTAIEKFILMEIDSLDGEKGCYASNKYLADFCQCGESTVSRAITKLRELGYIRIASFDGRTRVLHSCLAKTARQTPQIGKAESSNRQDRILDKVTSKEEEPLSGKPDDVPYDAVIDYLNEKTGKHYRSKAAATRKLIKARFADGYTLEDFRRVIDTKTSQWLNTDQDKFLRPETLFRPSHFESYLNESPQTSILDSVDWDKYQLAEIDPSTIH